MFINDQKVKLPAEIVADMEPKTVIIELKKGILKEGENTITFLFADSVGGTTGFSILGGIFTGGATPPQAQNARLDPWNTSSCC